ncbi:ATP-binding protein [Azonexus hydrophilus]|uniref:sensor histidine kinase n=1 Tax=Azonexus hydrophilus TaxID=418702 RepID=UPI00041BB63F|nr:ATP-binding protein [Azonexus hydrophilus]
MFKRQPEQLALSLALAGTLAVLIAFVVDLTLSYKRDIDTGEQRLQQFSVMMAEHTARAFEAVDVLVKEVATDLSHSRNNWPDWEPVRGWEYIAQRHSRAMPQLRDLIVFDQLGNQRFISTYFPPPPINVRDRPYFVALENGAPWSTFGPYVGRNSGRYTYAIAHRLTDAENRFAGAAFAAIEPAYMQDFCWSNRLSDDFDAVLTNARGEIVASCRPADLSTYSGILGRPAGSTLFDGRPAGLIPETGLARGNGLLISTSPVPGFPDLRMVAIIPTDSVLAGWRNRRFEIGTLGAMLIALMFSGAMFLRRQVGELREMTEALSDSRDQLETRIDQATAALAAEKDAAERANAAKSRFLAAASHDLRQPLHALSLFTTDLQRQAAAGRLREVPRIAEQIGASTQTLGDMLNALLDISRLDIDGVRPEIQVFALNDVFRQLHGAFHRQAEAHGLRLRFHPNRYYLRSDPRLLERMIGNLIANALRYTPAGGSVLVGARIREDAIRIEIRDSGIGIAREYRAAIFAEFFQVANVAREQDGGLGLGLSIVERLAKGLDIEVSLDSEIGNGTTFGLLVQRARAPSQETVAQQNGTVGLVHFVGNSPDLLASRALVASWNYRISEGDCASVAQLRSDSIVICDAENIPDIDPDMPLIILGSPPEMPLPKGSHRLGLPLRPARLRALLRASALRRPQAG